MDNQAGAADLGTLAIRTFDELRRGAGDDRETVSALAELAEVVGWILYDEDRQTEAHVHNTEALRLARLAGDRDIELLTLLNMSMQRAHVGSDREALQVAEVGYALAPSPRVRAMFRVRAAQALANLGDEAGAFTALRDAESLFRQGVGPLDPSWSSWITEAELLSHQGSVHAKLGRWSDAVPLLRRAVELDGSGAPRYRSVVRALLVRALIETGSPEEAEVVRSGLVAGSARADAIVNRVGA
jgi:tetratricopeptide (TPR) repeat protein